MLLIPSHIKGNTDPPAPVWGWASLVILTQLIVLSLRPLKGITVEKHHKICSNLSLTMDRDQATSALSKAKLIAAMFPVK